MNVRDCMRMATPALDLEPADWERILRHLPATNRDDRDAHIRAVATEKAAQGQEAATELVSDFERGVVHGEDMPWPAA